MHKPRQLPASDALPLMNLINRPPGIMRGPIQRRREKFKLHLPKLLHRHMPKVRVKLSILEHPVVKPDHQHRNCNFPAHAVVKCLRIGIHRSHYFLHLNFQTNTLQYCRKITITSTSNCAISSNELGNFPIIELS